MTPLDSCSTLTIAESGQGDSAFCIAFVTNRVSTYARRYRDPWIDLNLRQAASASVSRFAAPTSRLTVVCEQLGPTSTKPGSLAAEDISGAGPTLHAVAAEIARHRDAIERIRNFGILRQPSGGVENRK